MSSSPLWRLISRSKLQVKEVEGEESENIQVAASPVWTLFELLPPGQPSDRTHGRPLRSERSVRAAGPCP